MSAPKYAPARENGLKPYLQINTSGGDAWADIVWAPSLAEAKRYYGWPQTQHASVAIRRAMPEDMGSEA